MSQLTQYELNSLNKLRQTTEPAIAIDTVLASGSKHPNCKAWYKNNWDDIDPSAIAKNLTCEIEKMMGIFPNVPILQDTSQHEA